MRMVKGLKLEFKIKQVSIDSNRNVHIVATCISIKDVKLPFKPLNGGMYPMIKDISNQMQMMFMPARVIDSSKDSYFIIPEDKYRELKSPTVDDILNLDCSITKYDV